MEGCKEAKGKWVPASNSEDGTQMAGRSPNMGSLFQKMVSVMDVVKVASQAVGFFGLSAWNLGKLPAWCMVVTRPLSFLVQWPRV